MSCRNQYEKSGIRTFSDYVPGFAQGAYFPEDEPGTYCQISGCLCSNINGDNPEDCCGLSDVDETCPDCHVNLQEDGHGTIFCPNCKLSLEDLSC